MATTPAAARQTVIDLRAAVQRLSAAELREFTRWLAEWQGQNGCHADEDAALIARTKVRLPAAEQRRLKRLNAKSQRGVLTAKELQIYRDLAQRAEQLDGTRLAALAELVRRWDKPVGVVMAAIGWKGAEDGT
jgi:hypothetical protein